MSWIASRPSVIAFSEMLIASCRLSAASAWQRYPLSLNLGRLSRISRYAAGITNIDSSGAVIMPPTVGAAMRRVLLRPLVAALAMSHSSAAVIANALGDSRMYGSGR